MYLERDSPAVPGAVAWTHRRDAGAGADVRVLPDGCMDLIWHDDGLLVAGPDTTAHLIAGRPGDVHAGIRFPPGTGPAVLGIPAADVRNERVPLDDLWPQRRARELTERVAGAADRLAGLETAASASAAGRNVFRAGDPVPAGVLHGLRRGLPVREIARELTLSERQLHRRCLDVFGYGPKTLARVLRLERALGHARAGRPFADVAAVTGYADQAHLSREVRALAGVPLRRLLAEEAAAAVA